MYTSKINHCLHVSRYVFFSKKLGVQILSAQVTVTSYRKSEAAMGFIQHISSYLHEGLLEKIQSSPVIGMLNVPRNLYMICYCIAVL